MPKWGLYGGDGDYRMPESKEFNTREEAIAYGRKWYSANPHVHVKQIPKNEKPRPNLRASYLKENWF